MHQRRWLILSLIVLLSLVLTPAAGAANTVAAPHPQETGGVSEGRFVVRVYYDDPADIANLKNFDLVEYNNTKEQYVLAIVDAVEFAAIKGLGFNAAIDAEETANLLHVSPPPNQRAGIPGYPCYRTVEETYATGAASSPPTRPWPAESMRATRGKR